MNINGLILQQNNKHIDTRGSFERVFDQATIFDELKIMQVNLSDNPKKGTLRGLHFQVDGPPEHKLMKLNSGAIYMAVVDLRSTEETYLNVFQKELKYQDSVTVRIPSGCATGWISLENNTQITYMMTARFEECKYSGYRFDDPKFLINWPQNPVCISNSDLVWPKFKSK